MSANRWTVTIRRTGKADLRLHLPTLNEALAVARTDAAWYDGAAVHVSPILRDAAIVPQKG